MGETQYASFESWVHGEYGIPDKVMRDYLFIVLIECERTAAIRGVRKYGTYAGAMRVGRDDFWDEKSTELEELSEKVRKGMELDVGTDIPILPLYTRKSISKPYTLPFEDSFMQTAIEHIRNEISQV